VTAESRASDTTLKSPLPAPKTSAFVLYEGQAADPLLEVAEPQITHHPLDKLAVFKFILGFNEHTTRLDDALDALLQGVPESRREDA
jgi:hypothetical protein